MRIKTSIKVLMLLALFSVALPALAAFTISQGGTNATSFTNNALTYFDGTKLNSAALGSGCTFITGTLNCPGTVYTAAYPIVLTGSSFSLAFGTSTSNTWGGTQTFTNNPVLGTLTGLLGGNNGTLYSSATTTASCAGTVSCSSFTILGSSPVTLTGSASGTGLSTTSPWVAGQLAYVASNSAVTSVGTTTLTASSPLTGSFTQVGSGGSLGCQVASGSQAGCLSSTDWNTFNGKGSGSVTSIATNNGITGGTITTTGTIGLATINAGVLGAVTNGAVPTSQATSTLYGLGTNGFVLAEVAGIPTWVATTTLSTISGSLNLASQVTGILPIANGGTATSTGGVTNGVEFYNGSTLTNNAGLTYSGTLLGVGTTSPVGVLSVFDTPTNANLNAFIIGSSTSAFATTTLFTVSNTGVTTLSSGSAGKASLTFSGLSNSYGFYEADASHIGITDSGTAGPQLALGASSGFSLASTNGVYWTTSGTAIGTVDVGLRRLSANTLSLLTSSTNAGSFTPAGTFLAGTIGAGGTTTPFGLLASAGAAGGTSNLFVVSSSTSAFATTTVVQIDQNGNLLAGFNGAKVGINTTAPTQPLTIAGLTTGQSAELTPSTNFNGLFGLRLDNSSATEIAGFKANPSTGEIRLSTGSTYFPTFYSNGIEAARITTTGLTGFGTTTPFALFEIASSSNSSTFKSQLVLTDTNAGTNLKHWAFTSAAGALTIGTTSDLYATSTALSISANGIVQIKELAAAAGTFIAADPNGNLIATTSPSSSSSSGFTQAVQWATNAVLAGTPTYSNGASGVGATLTEVGSGALSVDGSAPVVSDRVLVKNQASVFQNGIYTVTATGSGIASYVLTRASDYNSNTTIFPGISTYVIGGTANTDTTWAMTAAAPITVGTTNLTYAESASGALTLPLSIANGGTATSSFYSGGIVYSDGAKLTQATGSGNSIFAWDNTNGRLGIGSSTPFWNLSIGSNYVTPTVASTSVYTVNSTIVAPAGTAYAVVTAQGAQGGTAGSAGGDGATTASTTISMVGGQTATITLGQVGTNGGAGGAGYAVGGVGSGFGTGGGSTGFVTSTGATVVACGGGGGVSPGVGGAASGYSGGAGAVNGSQIGGGGACRTAGDKGAVQGAPATDGDPGAVFTNAGAGKVTISFFTTTSQTAILGAPNAQYSSTAITVGTTSQRAALTVQGADTGMSIVQFWGTVTSTLYKFFEIDIYGHEITGGPSPTIGTCTGGSVLGDDNNGVVTSNSNTSCSINFAHIWPNTPACEIGPGSAASTVRAAVTTTSLAATFGTGNSSWSYHCAAHGNF